MSTLSFQDGMNWYTKCFLDGNIDGILPLYAEVLPIFLNGETKIISSHDDLRLVFASHLIEIRDANITKIKGVEETPSHGKIGRYSTKVNWYYFRNDIDPPLQSTSIYFVNQTASRCLIEMVEYKKMAFNDPQYWQTANTNSEFINCSHETEYSH